jgi:hypothetical protein
MKEKRQAENREIKALQDISLRCLMHAVTLLTVFDNAA